MKLKKFCSCKNQLDTKHIRIIGRNEMGLWYDCLHCRSTGILRDKKAMETYNSTAQQQKQHMATAS